MKKITLITAICCTIGIISAFVSCKKNSLSYCETTIPELSAPKPFTVLSESSETTDGVKNCTSKEVEFGPQFQEIVSLDPQSTVIYPGAVLNYKSFQDGTYIPIVGDRQPMTISISLTNITGNISERIEQPSLSSVREAIQRILQSKTSGSGTAASLAWQQYQIYSEKHFRLRIGGNYGNLFGDISANYEYANNEIVGRFLFQFTQEYYSIDMDAPQPGMPNFFRQEMNCSQIGDNSPVYVSSVKYGRKVFLMIESKSYDYSHMADIQASFDAFLSSGGVSIQANLSKLMQEKSIKAVVVGGPSYEGVKVINSFTGLKAYLLAGANYNQNSPGIPLSYTLRFVNDNSIAKLALYDRFTIRDCAIIPPNATYFQPASVSEIKLNHVLGDKEFGGNGPKVKLKTNLYLSTNKREVWAKLDLTMTETGGDHSTGSRIHEVKLWTCPAGKTIVGITSQKSQTVEYTDNDILYDRFDFPISNIIKHVEFLGDTDGDDLDLSGIESTGHLHKLFFNKISVEIQ